MKTFNDLTFIPHPNSEEGLSAWLEFDNGRGISVITGSSHFLSSEEEPYEVGFLQKDGDLGHIYSQDKGEIELLEGENGNDVAGYCTPEQVTLIMKAIQKL